MAIIPTAWAMSAKGAGVSEERSAWLRCSADPILKFLANLKQGPGLTSYVTVLPLALTSHVTIK